MVGSETYKLLRIQSHPRCPCCGCFLCVGCVSLMCIYYIHWTRTHATCLGGDRVRSVACVQLMGSCMGVIIYHLSLGIFIDPWTALPLYNNKHDKRSLLSYPLWVGLCACVISVNMYMREICIVLGTRCMCVIYVREKIVDIA
jgi:hypothetical protein